LSASIGSGTIGNSVTLLSSKTGSYATTGSNTFEGLQHINGAIEIHSGSNPELRFINNTTGIEYHIQNGDGGNFQIHNGTTNGLLFRFNSGSVADGNQNAQFFGGLQVSQSLVAHTIVGTHISASEGFSGSITGIGNVTAFSSSVAETFTTQSQRISSLESFSGSYATTGSNTFRGEQIISSSLIVTNEIKGTGSIFLQPDVTDSRKLEIYNTSVTDVHIKGTGGQTFLGDDTNFVEINDSLQTINITAVNGVYVTGIEETIGEFSQSVDSRFSASVASVTSLSASVASVTGDFSSSVATSFSASAYNVSASNAVQDVRINQLASFSGSYATTGSNIFYGTQVFTGSLYVTQDLIVQGSSSLQYITASAVDLGTNTIILNNDSPAVRFGGISVVDSGSSQATGSLFWDSLENHWISVRPSSSTEVANSAVLIYGPVNTGSLGDETLLTPGKIMVALGEDHIGDSIITQATDGSKISVTGGLDVTGEISASTINGIGNVTAYSQSVSASLAAIVANVGSGVGISITNLNSFSSSTLGRLDNIESFSSSVNTKMTEIGVVSGSLIASASTAKTTNDTQDGRLDNLELTSASVNTSVTALNSSSASQQISIDALNTVSGSNLGRLSNLELTSASVNTSVSNLNSFSSSVLTQLTEIGVVSGSLITSASTAKSTNDTQDGRLNNIESFSASVNTSITNINSFTSSVDTKMTEIGVVSGSLISSASAASISIAALNAYTSSNTSTTALNNFTASAETRFTEIGVVSGSLISSASAAKTTNDSQDVSISNLNTFSGSQLTQNSTLATYTGSVETRLTEIGVVSGSLISSASAAKITNDSQDVSITNINSFTQSFSQSVATDFSASDARLDVIEASLGGGGSLGSRVLALETSSANLNTFSASVLTQLTEIGVVSGSLIASASTAKTTNDTQNGRLTNLESTSASVNISISALNTSSASQQISIDALNVVSASNLSRLSQLETASGSAKIAISELNNFTSSFKQAISLSGQNVEILGDFTVRGSSTLIDSTTIQLGDNIIELNGTGAANGGLIVKDPTAPSTLSGSLLWDTTNDYWKAGTFGNESKVLVAAGDSVVSSSSQITITNTTGFNTFDTAISTSFSASNASITALSASVASVTGDFSSSVATSFSASNASIVALSASVASVTGDFSSSVATSFSASAASQLSLSSSFASSQAIQDTRLGLLETSTGSLNLFTSSIDTTIKTKLDAENVVSGSSQIDITATTGFTTFSSSIDTRISVIDGGTY
jgi:uncharacterized coiled-coil protein SlyX